MIVVLVAITTSCNCANDLGDASLRLLALPKPLPRSGVLLVFVPTPSPLVSGGRLTRGLQPGEGGVGHLRNPGGFRPKDYSTPP